MPQRIGGMLGIGPIAGVNEGERPAAADSFARPADVGKPDRVIDPVFGAPPAAAQPHHDQTYGTRISLCDIPVVPGLNRQHDGELASRW